MPHGAARRQRRPEGGPHGTCGRYPALGMADNAMQEDGKEKRRLQLGLPGHHLPASRYGGAPPRLSQEHCGGISNNPPPAVRSSASLRGGTGMVAVCLHGGQEWHLCCTVLEWRHLLYPGRRGTSLCAGPPAALHSLPQGLRLGFYIYNRERLWGVG